MFIKVTGKENGYEYLVNTAYIVTIIPNKAKSFTYIELDVSCVGPDQTPVLEVRQTLQEILDQLK